MATYACLPRGTFDSRSLGDQLSPRPVAVHDGTTLPQDRTQQYGLSITDMLQREHLYIAPKRLRQPSGELRGVKRSLLGERNQQIHIRALACIPTRQRTEKDGQADIALGPKRLSHCGNECPVLSQICLLAYSQLDLSRPRPVSPHGPALNGSP